MTMTYNAHRTVREKTLRESIAGLPLRQRQQIAEDLSWIDGLPLNEADIRKLITQFKDGQDPDRARALQLMCGPAEAEDRRIGSLNPDEIEAIFNEVWPA